MAHPMPTNLLTMVFTDLVNSTALKSLLHAAIALGKTPLPKTGRGYMVIKSISAKQRPRRPAK